VGWYGQMLGGGVNMREAQIYIKNSTKKLKKLESGGGGSVVWFLNWESLTQMKGGGRDPQLRLLSSEHADSSSLGGSSILLMCIGTHTLAMCENKLFNEKFKVAYHSVIIENRIIY